MYKLRTNEIFKSATLSLFAVERVEVRHHRSTAACHAYGSIAPIAIIVSGPGNEYALDMAGRPVDIDELRHDLPDLDTKIS